MYTPQQMMNAVIRLRLQKHQDNLNTGPSFLSQVSRPPPPLPPRRTWNITLQTLLIETVLIKITWEELCGANKGPGFTLQSTSGAAEVCACAQNFTTAITASLKRHSVEWRSTMMHTCTSPAQLPQWNRGASATNTRVKTLRVNHSHDRSCNTIHLV